MTAVLPPRSTPLLALNSLAIHPSVIFKRTLEKLGTVMKQRPDSLHVSRRAVLEAGTAAAAVSFIGTAPALASARAAGPDLPPEPVTIELRVNGRHHVLTVDPRTTVLDALREHLALTGTKKGCDQGQCGACTVIVNGQRINSCLTLAVMHTDDEITTIEGLADGDTLHAMQAAFVRHDGLQCGYCTPGQICSAVAVLAEHRAGWPSYATTDVATAPALSDVEISERMSGNICRCSAYANIVAAIRDVAEGDRT
ncbi:MAG TPA: 2Fe-2S iron-sulfur cluster-binding protein [Xanthobacteraceae bacterium]